MSTIHGSLTHTKIEIPMYDSISERALNYTFLREFLVSFEGEEEAKWVEFVSIQLGYENAQPKDKLLSEIDRVINTAKNSNKFGL